MDGNEFDGLPDGFGHWPAGFIDGEGCFTVYKQKPRYRIKRERRPGKGQWNRGTTKADYRPRFSLALRDDDIKILEEIAERLQIGRIHRKHTQAKGNAHSAAQWNVMDHNGCMKLIRLLERFPLRAKKKRDFELWREAVAESCRRFRSKPRLESAYLALKNVKEYKSTEIETDSKASETARQLDLFAPEVA